MARRHGSIGHVSSHDHLTMVEWLNGKVPDRVTESLDRPSTLLLILLLLCVRKGRHGLDFGKSNPNPYIWNGF